MCALARRYSVPHHPARRCVAAVSGRRWGKPQPCTAVRVAATCPAEHGKSTMSQDCVCRRRAYAREDQDSSGEIHPPPATPPLGNGSRRGAGTSLQGWCLYRPARWRGIPGNQRMDHAREVQAPDGQRQSPSSRAASLRRGGWQRGTARYAASFSKDAEQGGSVLTPRGAVAVIHRCDKTEAISCR